VTFIPRPQGLGLGAKLTVPPEEADKDKDKKHITKPGDKYKPKVQMELPMDANGKVRHHRTLDEELKPVKEAFYKGAPLEIISGRHSGLKASVVSRHSHDSLLVLLPSEEKVVVRVSDVEQLDDRDVIIRRKMQEERRKEAEKQRRREEREHKKRKRESGSSDRHSKSSKKSRTSAPDPTWLRADIRVKVVSKELGGGKFYCKAGWVVDVLARARCTIKLEGTNVLLEGIKQSDLETVVPPVQHPVLVLQGEWKGQKGVILQRDSAKNQLVVQLDEDYEVVTLRMDDVAQFR
jgi:G patch domain/KOW motif-containing protein